MMEKSGHQGRAIMSMRKFWRKKKSVQANLKFACHEYKDLQSENHCLALQMLIFTTAELQIRQNGGKKFKSWKIEKRAACWRSRTTSAASSCTTRR